MFWLTFRCGCLTSPLVQVTVCGDKNMDICVRLIGCAGLGSGPVSVGVRVSVSSKESVNVRSSVNGSEKRCAATHEK